MRILKSPGNSKMREVAARLGVDDMRDYFRDAIKRGLSQREMALECMVTATTINNWLKGFGFKPFITYRERKGRAA